MIPYSVSNPDELQGGYVRGTWPSQAHHYLSGLVHELPKDLENNAWKTKCQGIVHIYGEPDIEIKNRVELMAPAFVVHTDPVTGLQLNAGLQYPNGVDEFRQPNGGVISGNIYIDMQPGDIENPSGALPGVDPQFRKKQVAFQPEVYMFLRERTDIYKGSTFWGLTFAENPNPVIPPTP